MKLAPMAGLDINYYKGYVIEWIDYMNSYRVCEKEHPEFACFYADTIMDARETIDYNERRK